MRRTRAMGGTGRRGGAVHVAGLELCGERCGVRRGGSWKERVRAELRAGGAGAVVRAGGALWPHTPTLRERAGSAPVPSFPHGHAPWAPPRPVVLSPPCTAKSVTVARGSAMHAQNGCEMRSAENFFIETPQAQCAPATAPHERSALGARSPGAGAPRRRVVCARAMRSVHGPLPLHPRPRQPAARPPQRHLLSCASLGTDCPLKTRVDDFAATLSVEKTWKVGEGRRG